MSGALLQKPSFDVTQCNRQGCWVLAPIIVAPGDLSVNGAFLFPLP